MALRERGTELRAQLDVPGQGLLRRAVLGHPKGGPFAVTMGPGRKELPTLLGHAGLPKPLAPPLPPRCLRSWSWS